MKILGETNKKCHATYGEKKAMPLAHIHSGHIRATGTEPGNYKFKNTHIGKTVQDYGNIKTQVIRGK